MSPDRFHKFILTYFAYERLHSGGPIGFINKVPGEKDNPIITEGPYHMFRYTYNSDGTLSPHSFTTDFLVVHHIPSLISNLSFWDLFEKDLRQVRNSALYKHLKKDEDKFNGWFMRRAVFYLTNKNCTHIYKRNNDAFMKKLNKIQDSFGILIHPADPLGIAESALNEHRDIFYQIIEDTLLYPDGLMLSLSPSGISVLPYLLIDAVEFPGQIPQVFTLNVTSNYLATPMIEALHGLQDLIRVVPDEKRIEHFLLDHPELLLGNKYVDVRPQVTIGDKGEKPDFFLETGDGPWELLELKLPRVQIDTKAGYAVTMSAYLSAAIRQCAKYLIILEKTTPKKKLKKDIAVFQSRV